MAETSRPTATATSSELRHTEVGHVEHLLTRKPKSWRIGNKLVFFLDSLTTI
jgi:hypothetical protein